MAGSRFRQPAGVFGSLVFCVLAFSGCAGSGYGFADGVAAQLKGSEEPSAVIDMSTYAPDDWDELAIVCSFTSNREVNRVLGSDWTSGPIIDDDFDRDIMVLIQDNSVVAYDLVPRDLVLCKGSDDERIEGTRVISQDNSRFHFYRAALDGLDPLFLDESVQDLWVLDADFLTVDRQ